MLYNTCPTCGFFLGNLTLKFEEEKNKICNDPKLTQNEIEEKLQKVIMDLKVRRYCCRMRFMSYKDVVQDVSAPFHDDK